MFAQDRLEVLPTEVASVRTTRSDAGRESDEPGAPAAEAGGDAPSVLLVDIREPFERDVCEIPGSVHLPMAEIPDRWAEVCTNLPVVLYCHTGVRSLYATRYLRGEGLATVWSLRGGIDLWARELDPQMPRY